MPETTYYARHREERLRYQLRYEATRVAHFPVLLAHCGEWQPVREVPWRCPTCQWIFAPQEESP